MVLLVTLALAIFGYISWHKPLYGVYIIAATLPSYLIRPALGGLPTTVLELMILTLFAVWLLRDNKWRSLHLPWDKTIKVWNPVPSSFRIPLSLFLISAFVAMVISPNQPHAFGIFKAYFIEPILYLIVFVYEIKTEKHRETVVHALGATTIVLGLIAVYQALTGNGIPNPFWDFCRMIFAPFS